MLYDAITSFETLESLGWLGGMLPNSIFSDSLSGGIAVAIALYHYAKRLGLQNATPFMHFAQRARGRCHSITEPRSGSDRVDAVSFKGKKTRFSSVDRRAA